MALISLIITALTTDQHNVNIGIIKNKEDSMLGNRIVIKIIVSWIIIPKYTPAITVVDECNRADIGVGAFMAFNNHELKGNWADLVNKINNKEKAIDNSIK